MTDITPGFYRHYSGKSYEVLGIARHSETLEEMVVYKALYVSEFPEGQLWVRPKAMFGEGVTINGVVQPRFSVVKE